MENVLNDKPKEDKSPYGEPRQDLINEAVATLGKALQDFPMNPEEFSIMLLHTMMLGVSGAIEMEQAFPKHLSIPTADGHLVALSVLTPEEVAKLQKERGKPKSNLIIPNVGNNNLFH